MNPQHALALAAQRRLELAGAAAFARARRRLVLGGLTGELVGADRPGPRSSREGGHA